MAVTARKIECPSEAHAKADELLKQAAEIKAKLKPVLAAEFVRAFMQVMEMF